MEDEELNFEAVVANGDTVDDEEDADMLVVENALEFAAEEAPPK